MPASISLDPEYIAPLVTYLTSPQASGITGRFVYASGGDVCIYAEPLALHGGSNSFVRKDGKWTQQSWPRSCRHCSASARASSPVTTMSMTPTVQMLVGGEHVDAATAAGSM